MSVPLVAVVAVVAVGRMFVEDYIVDLDLGVDIVLHGLMYLVRIIVVVLVLDLDLGIRRLLVISVFLFYFVERGDVPPESYSSLCLNPLILPSILTPGEPTSGPCPQSFEDP